jgi:hypothetical protein
MAYSKPECIFKAGSTKVMIFLIMSNGRETLINDQRLLTRFELFLFNINLHCWFVIGK